jgi:hypothetical protein
MAINSAVRFEVNVVGDGTATSFTFDITKGPINFNVGGNNPTDIFSLNSTQSFTLSGTKVTVVFATAPATAPNITTATFELLFPGV